MDSVKKIVFLLIFIFCETSDALLLPKLRREKRWEGNSDMSNMFRGTAGVDYPDYKTIPTTSFRCDDQQYEGGLYADVETQCQVYHICHDGRKDSFLCGKGTIFNQEILACDYWYSTECDKAPSFYYVNAEIGNSDSTSNKQYNHQSNNQDSYNRPNNPNQGQDRQVPKITSGNFGSNQQGNGGNFGSNQQANEKSCCCLKNNYIAPWNFPSQ